MLRADAVQAAGAPAGIVLALAVQADAATKLAGEALGTHPVRVLSAASADRLQRLAATSVRGTDTVQTLVALVRTAGTVAAGRYRLVCGRGHGDQRQQQDNSGVEVHNGGWGVCWDQ